VGKEAQASSRGQHIFSMVVSLAASLTSGAIFLASLIDQLALVEVAASLCLALQVFLFSSTIADLIERRKTPRTRNLWVVVFAVLLIAFYAVSRYSPQGARFACSDGRLLVRHRRAALSPVRRVAQARIERQCNGQEPVRTG